MSKYKVLTVALAAALAAPAAFATDLNVGPDGVAATLPKNVFVDSAVIARNHGTQVDIVANATSVYLGRNTGYNIRMTLSQGVFNGNPVATGIGGTANVTIAGGGDNANTVTYSVTPVTSGVVQGAGIRLAAGSIAIDGVAALADGGTVSVDVRVFDPVGGNQLGETLTADLIRTVEGWTVTYSAGDDDQRIDVGAESSKRWFGDTVVGSGAAGNVFNAGRVQIALNPLLDNPMGLSLGTSSMGTHAQAALALAGSDFAAFTGAGSGIYLSTTDACPTAGAIYATVATDGESATFPANTLAGNVNGKHICFDANGVDQVQRQQVVATTTVSQTDTNPSPAFGSGDTLTEMRYNGTVVRVDHFNPASNPGQQSYLRVINPSNTVGLVSVEATCQDGTRAPGLASFTLAPGASRQVNSGDLEAGGNGISGGLGSCGSGKSRLVVTGEFANMGVQNFLRNSLQGSVVNTHINNVTDEESKD